ncbi:MAG: ion transporter [Myxococcales bacterium]|nr:ion transporter [Myxococcales bacterium]
MDLSDLKALDRRFEAARTQLLQRRLIDLEPEQLLRLEGNLRDEAHRLVDELQTTREERDRALHGGQYHAQQRARERALELSRRYEETRRWHRGVVDALHERRLKDRMVERLGSKRRMMLYDGGIISLILLVVGLLCVDLGIGVSDRTALWFDVVDLAACTVFLADFFWRHSLADDKRWFWRHYWLDFVTSIPIPTSPIRAGRLVRLARLVRVLRLIRALRLVLFFWRGMDPLVTALNMTMVRRSLWILVAVLLLGGLGIWVAEGGSESAAGVEDLGQSLWWSFTTVVTGGFGDIRNPTTWPGRMLTVVLILAGMVVVGVFTATLTSVLVREEETTAAVLALDDKLERSLDEIRRALRDAPTTTEE